MAKARGFLGCIFTKIGGSLFGILSGLEERCILPGAARWLKLSILGLLVTLVSASSIKADDDIIMCYVPIEEPHLIISDVSAVPNPTAGNDTVIVKATAKLESFIITQETPLFPKHLCSLPEIRFYIR